MSWEIVQGARNIIFVGESGCGKTELAINCALALKKKHGHERVSLLDMDQSKPSFRSRDARKAVEDGGVELVFGEQLMESPIIPPGVKKRLMDPEGINVLDVGGNEIGAVNMGQFEEFFGGEDTIVFFVVSPYRLLSLDSEHIKAMMEAVEDFSKLRNFRFIGNPNMGEYTDAEAVLEGWTMIQERLGELNLPCNIIAVPEWLKELELPASAEHRLIVRRYLQYP
ncbi:MAG: hypothetical protein II335_06270 [Firmicutes bacterium]|nr:hypothetical protein [Bacillota bacterium]